MNGKYEIGCPDCGGKWMYTLEPEYEYSGCDTWGGSMSTRVSRECINCRKPQSICRYLSSWETPQEFSSPEMDAWFPAVWEADGGPERFEAEQKRAAEAKREAERLQRVRKAAESFLPPEYRKSDK